MNDKDKKSADKSEALLKETEQKIAEEVEKMKDESFDDLEEKIISETTPISLYTQEMEQKLKDEASQEENAVSKDQNEENEDDKLFRILNIVSKGLLILILLVIIGFGVYMYRGMTSILSPEEKEKASATSSNAPQVIVPDLTGMTEDEAIKELQGKGIGFKQEKAIASEEPAGTIISQDLKPGEKVDEYSTILVTISEGMMETRMPDLKGSDTNSAIHTLTGMQITNIKTEKAYQAGASFDSVISTEPASGELVSSGQEVVLKVCTGSVETTATPDIYVGIDEATALESARADKLIPVVKYAYSNNWPEGEVLMQSVDKNAPVMSGTEVLLFVSRGPIPDETLYSASKKVQLDLPETATGKAYKILVEEETRDFVFEICLEEGDSAPGFPHAVEIPIIRGTNKCTAWYYEKSSATDGYIPRASWPIIEEQAENNNETTNEEDNS